MPAYSKTKYEADNGQVHPIRLQPDTLTAAGSVPAGGVTSPISADIRKSKREYGLGPRGVSASRTVGTAPDTFKKRIFIPVLVKADYASGSFIPGGQITYKGQSYTIDSLIPEYVK